MVSQATPSCHCVSELGTVPATDYSTDLEFLSAIQTVARMVEKIQSYRSNPTKYAPYGKNLLGAIELDTCRFHVGSSMQGCAGDESTLRNVPTSLLLSVASKSGRPQKMVAASIKMVQQPHMGSRTVSHGCMPAVLVTVMHSTHLKPGLGSPSLMPECSTRIGIVSTVSLMPSRRI
jgi:hypothetical protein